MLTPSPTRTLAAYSPDGRTFGPYGFDSLFPRLVAFDLDYTLWPGWIDTHYAAPLRRSSSNTLNSVHDVNDKHLSLYPQASRILHRLQQSQTHIAATSRTDAPNLTRDALALLLVPPPRERPRERPQRAIDFFESLEIYPESKLVHFGEMHKKTGIPYSEMLFISGDPSPSSDAENRLVERLGVTYLHLLPPSTSSTPAAGCAKLGGGLTTAAFEEGIREWRRRRGWPEDDDEEEEEDESDMDISSDEDERASDGSGCTR